MSYKDFEKALKLLENHKDKIMISSSMSEKDILQAEETLKIKFPNSYKQFLKKYGCLLFASQQIYGLYNNVIIDDTILVRKENTDPVFPETLIPIHELGNGEKSCLDTSQMSDEGECPVVAWYFGPTLSNGKFEILAEDFGAFLLEKVQWGIESITGDRRLNNNTSQPEVDLAQPKTSFKSSFNNIFSKFINPNK